MSRRIWMAVTFAAGVGGALLAGSQMVAAQGSSAMPVAAVPSERGGQDIWGAYVPDADWPKEISDLPGHGGWTWGAGQSIFAESADRVYGLMRGELPNIERPRTQFLKDIAPSLSFPIGRLPWRDATAASLPANGGTGSSAEEGISAWLDRGLEFGVDARWEHCIMVFDREGNIIEEWTQWDSMLQRPHFVAVNPYDPEKHVWVIDDHKHIVHKFTNDGKELVQSIGTYGEPGDDENHFNRPTMMDFLPDGTFFVADGYNGTRVVKFDADGNYLLSWGEPGQRGGETRPGYWHNVHGIAVHPETGRVFVNDRTNKRVQVFDSDGNYLDEWSFGPEPTDIHDFTITADGHLWAADRGTNKMLKYDLDGNFLYSWGTWGNFPGGMWGVHGISVDEEQNFYVAEVDNGGFQKYVPREGANPDMLVGPPVRSAW
ncbi:MAG: 6-bladed beta-propeller [Gammaproteobacteria bacterium]|nr:6-bladed beta-propeller [Gammaproteobacteria bacterium]MDH3508185.1 6-bladed beta-propeller [Gammaproteobacteria bacterium]